MGIKEPVVNIPEKLAPSPFTRANPDILLRPFFSFQYLHRKRHVSLLEESQQAELAKRLCELSELTWQELREAGRHGLGYEIIHKDLHFELPSNVKGETILAFRYCGKLAMVGFREKNVFHIIGLDKDFAPNSCYDH